MHYLDKINSPKDLKNLNIGELSHLASEIREEIISTVSKTGGHLAPNLGVVELTIALHRVLNAPRDKVVWDVGHQTYTHKLLTGRRKKFSTLRQHKGLSGFPRREESRYDAFGTGHSSTSISAALGMAKARDIKNEDYTVAAIIGDASLSGGMAFEALNQAGALGTDLLVILNDNEMSISKNVGALSIYLNKLMATPLYNRLRRRTQYLVKKTPVIGSRALKFTRRLEEGLKNLFIPSIWFEELGFRYFGPVDGHNLTHLIDTLERVKKLEGPILVHIITKKGKGYRLAEEEPAKFHGLGPFDIKLGRVKRVEKRPTYTQVFGETLLRLARRDKRIVGITAAMEWGTGLEILRDEFPGRFFDVGIAEQHAVTFAAGLAVDGLKPVVAIYSTFLQRAYDQVLHDVCLQNLPVLFAIDRAGIVEGDGATHQGIFDIAYLSHIPNLTLMAPKDENELRHMLYTGLKHDGPIALRYPKEEGRGVKLDRKLRVLPIGRAEILRRGEGLAIFALGSTVYPALEVAEKLDATLVNLRFAKPLDKKIITTLARECGRIVIVEEGTLEGGVGTRVLELLEEEGLGNIKVRCIGLPDKFLEHGPRNILLSKYGLTSRGILKTIKKWLKSA
ncbi:1-deoxy-D-xylulose-5-phosphate synthase [bacterium]|nr:1-deoxy-D-xylulose-5-phosphate synthase [bacterium]